jgi:hypothetical protein
MILGSVKRMLDGYEIFAGGKGGPFPKIGVRIERMADEQRVLEVIADLVNFHDLKTEKNSACINCLANRNFFLRKYNLPTISNL